MFKVQLFNKGVFVEKDHVAAQTWYLTAIEGGSSDAYEALMSSRWSWDAYQNPEKKENTLANAGGYIKNVFFFPGDLLTYLASENSSIREISGVNYSTYGGWPVGIFSALVWIIGLAALND